MAIFFFTKILQRFFIENIRQDDITFTQEKKNIYSLIINIKIKFLKILKTNQKNKWYFILYIDWYSKNYLKKFK